MPSIASGRTSAGAMTGTSPASTACAIARLTRASSSRAPTPVRKANREPLTLAPALGVDGLEQRPDVEVVADREVVGRDLADHLDLDAVGLAAGGRALHDVRHGEVRRPQRRLRRGLLRLELLHLGGQRLGLLEDGGALLRGGLLDRLRDRLLLPAQAVRPGHDVAAVRVGLQERVDQGGVVATGLLRGAHAVGVLAQQLQVDHDASLGRA